MKRIPPPLPGLGAAKPGPAAAQPPFAAAPLNPTAVLQNAIRAHDAGRLDEAERGYLLADKLAPNNALILAHLGSLLLERERWEEGAARLRRSLQIDPKQASMHTNLGNALVKLGRFDEAMTAYETAIALQPPAERPVAFNDLGVYLHELGREDDAVAAYGRAIDSSRGKIPEPLAHRAVSLLELNRAPEALADLDAAIALRPDYVDALINRGTALYEMMRFEEALTAFDHALSIKNVGVEGHNNRGVVLHRLDRFEEALASVETAHALAPKMAEGLNNKGLVLQALDRLDEALACADQAAALAPDIPETFNHRGLALAAAARPEDALADYDRAMALDPDYPDAHWNKALLLILTQHYAEGWKLFEWRWKRSGAPPQPVFDRPLWLGETPLAGKTILLHAEQGLGDTLHMLRYVPILAGQGAKITLAVQPPLVALACTLAGSPHVLDPDEPTGLFDVHCPLMSLPLALGTTVQTIPADVPYLSAPEEKVGIWRERLGPKARRRVGLAWSGSRNHKNDRNRSIALSRLLPLLDADADFHSLQTEYREDDAALMRADGRIRDHSDALADFTDTAALIDQMDLVISVDTAVAHLAGALAKPLFLLITHVPDYRWHQSGQDSPWYPTARLFRQASAGDWDGVVADVAKALA